MFCSPRLIRLTTGPFACAALLGVMSLDAHAASVTISDVNPEITKTPVDPREIATIENALPEGINICVIPETLIRSLRLSERGRQGQRDLHR